MAVTTDATIRPDQLETELTNAGIDVSRGVGTSGASTGTIHTYDANGKLVDLPDEAQSVVNSHDPQPIVDPRIAVIDDMDSISDADKAALKSLITG
jgi:hypothetical protein